MNNPKIEWVPSPIKDHEGYNDGKRWELFINNRYRGRVAKHPSGKFNALLYTFDVNAFSINDAGRKLLAYALANL